MHRDPENYKDPLAFEPSRWYDPDESGLVKPGSSLVEGHWTFGYAFVTVKYNKLSDTLFPWKDLAEGRCH